MIYMTLLQFYNCLVFGNLIFPQDICFFFYVGLLIYYMKPPYLVIESLEA